jgi:hypothetical protein
MGVPGRWADEIPPEAPRWVRGHEDYVPRGLITVVAGKTNIGKTTWGLWCAGQVVQAGGSCWINTKEDTPEVSLAPRLEVAGIDRTRIRISTARYSFPKDLDRFAKDVAEGDERADGRAFDLIVLDSLERHIHGFGTRETALDALDALQAIVREADIGLVFLHHLVKGRATSVAGAIAGGHVILDQAKAIFLFGPEPHGEDVRLQQLLHGTVEKTPKNLVLACWKMNGADVPDSLAFQREFQHLEVTDTLTPYLRLVGPSDTTAEQLLTAINDGQSAATTEAESLVNQAAVWCIETLEAGPMPSKELVTRGKEAGFTERTLERARKRAGVESFKGEDGKWWVRNSRALNSANSANSATTLPLADMADMADFEEQFKEEKGT